MRRFLIIAIILAGFSTQSMAEPVRAAYFGILLIDTSLNPDHVAEDKRIEMIEARLLEALTEGDRYQIVDTAPVAKKADLYANLAQCNGCDARLAKELGADVAITGEVQKVSNLILAMTVYIRDAETGALVGGGSADIRGNTDKSWMRGINWLIKNRILGQ